MKGVLFYIIGLTVGRCAAYVRLSALGNAQVAPTRRFFSILGIAQGAICVAGLRNSIIPTQILGVRYSDFGSSKLRKT